MPNPLINFVVRGFQFLFGIVILGLTVTLIRDHHLGSLPGTLGFAAAAAAATLLGAFVGIAASFVSVLEGPIGLGIDGVVAVIDAIAGILMALKLKGVKCALTSDDLKNLQKLGNNDMLNGGWFSKGIPYWVDPDKIISHCKMAQADLVFMFLTVALLIAAALLTFLRMRKGY